MWMEMWESPGWSSGCAYQNINTLKTGFKFVITYVLRRQWHESAANSGNEMGNRSRPSTWISCGLMATAPLNNLGKIALISNFVLLFWPCIGKIWVKPKQSS